LKWAYLSREYGGGHGGDYDEDDDNSDDYDDVDNGDGLANTDGRPPVLYEEEAFKLAKAQSELAKWDILSIELRDSAMAQEACDSSRHVCTARQAPPPPVSVPTPPPAAPTQVGDSLK
jgi:hypothetical protein